MGQHSGLLGCGACNESSYLGTQEISQRQNAHSMEDHLGEVAGRDSSISHENGQRINKLRLVCLCS